MYIENSEDVIFCTMALLFASRQNDLCNEHSLIILHIITLVDMLYFLQLVSYPSSKTQVQ